jgi:hypothetical protein
VVNARQTGATGETGRRIGFTDNFSVVGKPDGRPAVSAQGPQVCERSTIPKKRMENLIACEIRCTGDLTAVVDDQSAVGFRAARVTADGKWVMAFLDPKSGGPSGPEQLMRMPFAGGTPELIFQSSPDSEISCASPVKSLCVIAEGTEDGKEVVVRAVDPVKGRGLELARFDLHPSQAIFHPGTGTWSFEISPDATLLAVRESAEGPIHIISLRGQQEVVIQPKGLDMHNWYWTADGTGFYVSNRVKGGTVLMHVDLQGNAHFLWENYGSGASTDGLPSPDGRHLMIMGWTTNSNMWMMENF